MPRGQKRRSTYLGKPGSGEGPAGGGGNRWKNPGASTVTVTYERRLAGESASSISRSSSPGTLRQRVAVSRVTGKASAPQFAA